MKKILVFCLVALGGVQASLAQDKSAIRDEVRQQRIELMTEARSSSQTEKGVTASAVSATDVGEPDSFGKNAKFLGVASSGVIIITASCDPAVIGPLGPDDRCIEVPDPSVPVPATTFNDIARITIPGKSVDNVIYAIANHTFSTVFTNTNATQSQARISYTPGITIESEALNDPTLIDPNTGLPYNGKFTTTGFGTRSISKPLPGGAFELDTLSYSRANTNGFSRTFFAALGLPNNVINQLYKKDMTIRLNVRIASQYVSDATIAYSIRFLGN